MRILLFLNSVQVMYDPVSLAAAQRGFTEIVGEARPDTQIIGQRHMVGVQNPSGGNGLRRRRLVLCRFDEARIGDKADGRQNADDGNDGQHLDHRETGTTDRHRATSGTPLNNLWH